MRRLATLLFGPAARAAVRRIAITAIAVMTIGLACACVLAWIPVWPCSLLEHFRLHYAVLGVIAMVGAAALRRRIWLALATLATLPSLVAVASELTVAPRPLPQGGAPVRVLILNVHTASDGFARVRDLIADERPDLLGLLEVDQRWLDALAPAVAGYPARIEAPRDDNFGIALYARGQLTGSAEDLGGPLPSVVADVAIDDARFAVILTHPIPPMSGPALEWQGAQLDAVADRARRSTGPVLVMGDLNATPWSRPFERLVERSRLCDSRAGFGVRASFPATSTLMRIPIDHLLASCTVGVRDRRIGRDVGSDHLPVIVDLVVPRPR